MSAKQQAIQDIREDLHKQGKCFLAFRTELNNRIREIIKEYNKERPHDKI